MRRVLVTGAGGRLGSLVTRELRLRGWTVRALVHRTPVADVEETAFGDLTEAGSLTDAVRDTDAVLHLAAVTHARRAADYRRGNVDGTRALLEAAAAAGVKRFVFASTRTAAVDGGWYAVSKLEAERLVDAAAIEHVIVRLPEVLGLGSGEGIDDIVARARAGRAIPLVGGGGDEIRPVAAADVVRALAVALEAAAAPGQRYVLGGGAVSLRQFAEECIAHYRSSSRIVSVPVAAVRVASVAARALPLPVYPDQLARLRAAKDPPTPEAAIDLGFRARPLAEALGDYAASPHA